MARKQLLLEFTDNEIKLIELTKVKKQITILSHKQIDLPQDELTELSSVLKELLGKKKFASRRCSLLVSKSSVLTKSIELPKMKHKDLEQLLSNNVQDYFTVKMEEYLFTYRITNSFDKEVMLEGQPTMKPFMNVLLIAFPKEELESILQGCKKNHLKPSHVDVYPNVVLSTYEKADKDLAIIEVHEKRVSFTLTEKENLFMYASFNPKEQDDFSFYQQEEEHDLSTNIYNNINGYLNFYSSKHYGQKPNEVYLIGDENLTSPLYDKLQSQFEGMVGVDFFPFSIKEKGKRRSFPFVPSDYLGLLTYAYNPIDKHGINFLEPAGNTFRQDRQKTILLTLTAACTILGMGYFISVPFYTQTQETRQLQEIKTKIEENQEVVQAYRQYEIVQSMSRNKNVLVNEMKNETIDFGMLISVVNSTLPNGVHLIQFHYAEGGKINATFDISNTLLSGNLVDNINDLELFETVHLDGVNLNNKPEPLLLNLQLKEDKLKEFQVKGEMNE